MKMGISKWQNEFEQALKQKNAVILCGNIRDRYLYRPPRAEDVLELLTFKEYLVKCMGRNASRLFFYDPVSKEQTVATSPAAEAETAPAGGNPELSGPSAPKTEPAGSVLDRDLDSIRRELSTGENVCGVIQYSDKVTLESAQTEEGMRLILHLEKTIENMPPTNKLVLAFLFSDQIPRELYQNHPKVKLIEIPNPDRKDLELLFQDFYKLPVADAEHARNITDGLKFLEIEQIVSSLEGGFDINIFEERVRLYKFGEIRNYWDEVSLEKINNAKEIFSQDVKGQDEAIDKVVTVIVRARADIQRKTGGNPRSPRGKLFFAGPTGVGKTLMVKTIADFLFESKDAVLRFDMSEYSQEFQVTRLYGAPPGYVGYESGGTLTNGIKAKPFSVVLFDEIEKAHARVFDIFLQILEDGRLTDSRGETVFFSESIIIFTSNLGTRTTDINGNPITERSELDRLREANDVKGIREHFADSVESFFQYEISRPELLNRIGRDNIVVFNYITTEETMKGMFDHYLKEVQEEFNEYYTNLTPRLQLSMDIERIRDLLYEQNTEVIKLFGGRQVENLINMQIRDNLARSVLEAEFRKLQSARIKVGVEDEKLAFELEDGQA